ncbi:MAG: S41 family peptidase [Bacteroidota bacterium]
MKNSKKILIGLIITVSLSFVSFTDPGERFFEIAKNLDIYATLFKELNSYYVDEINPNKVVKNSITSMLKQLDPYTNYYAEDDIEDYMTMTTGKYNGIGAVIGNIKNKNIVMMVYEDSPAAKVGLRIGDEIVKLDGVDIRNKKEIDLNMFIKGQNGTALKATVLRYGATKTEELSIIRDVVKVLNVPYFGMINETVGYINLTDFSATAAKEVKQAFVELKTKGMKNLILDVRENPGGLLNMAVDICNLFLPKDSEIVSTKGKAAEWNKTYKGLNQAVDTDMPIVVLTNNHSASAAEIVAGVLQDYDRAVLIGQRSFGKGLVQITRDLSYNCKLKVTTAKYYIPSGRCIQAIDYSHRNADGSVGKVPDSLITAFKTKNNRVVYDGGGIKPDIEIEKNSFAPITNSLVQELLIFDYANKYVFEHPNKKSAQEFSLSEAEFSEFVNWLKSKNYDYTTQVEKDLLSLEASAKKEKYMNGIQEQFNALKTKISAQRKGDILLFKQEIKNELEKEIVMHMYLQKGEKEASFVNDPEIKEALKLFSDMPKYKSILKLTN